jgi:hypothetical protein
MPQPHTTVATAAPALSAARVKCHRSNAPKEPSPAPIEIPTSGHARARKPSHNSGASVATKASSAILVMLHS